jgi:Fis family transcriptional regulator
MPWFKVIINEGNMTSNFSTPTTNIVTQSSTIPTQVVTNNIANSTADNLFVTNLSSISLEELVKKRLEVHFQQQTAAEIDPAGLKLYDIVLRQVEKPLLELALRATNGNQVKTAQMLGINRNTLKKKIDIYKIKVKRAN